jgi:antitoxin component YwqK of YwqJK toxin-antitoxin module
MKKIVMLLVMLSVGFTYAQDKIEPQLEKKGDLTLVTYFHENGEIQQLGMFNADGKLHGEWTSFDTEGNKVAVGNYEAGKKVGKWFFWTGDSLKEVDYNNSKIVSVNKWDNKTKVAVRNK